MKRKASGLVPRCSEPKSRSKAQLALVLCFDPTKKDKYGCRSLVA